MFFKDDFVGTPSGMKCPINGSNLIYDGYEYGTMDGDSYYHSEADPSLKYEKNMRSFFLELVHKESRWMSPKEERIKRRYFKQDDNGEWEEWFAVEGTYTLFPLGTPKEKVDAHIQKEQEAKEERKREYDRKVTSGEIDPLAFPETSVKLHSQIPPVHRNGHCSVRIRGQEAKPIASDLVEVKPMSPPQGVLFYLDFNQNPAGKTAYPYLVTDDNIERVKKNFKTEDIVIGDEITSWDKGGWNSLSGRAGEHLRRNGEILYTRLTRMS